MVGAPGAATVLVVDDDADLRGIVAEALALQGITASGCADGDAALDFIRARSPDLVILDLGLPGTNGLDVLRQVRAMGNLPVIVLTGRSDETDRIVGLEMGADDYVVKPFSPRELAARVKTVLRRAGSPDQAAHRFEFDGLSIDRATREVWVDGVAADLTAKEFDLLAFLAASPRRVFSREDLLRGVWHSEPEWQNPSTVAEHIHRLRRKIETDPGVPRRLVTLRGAGYRFIP